MTAQFDQLGAVLGLPAHPNEEIRVVVEQQHEAGLERQVLQRDALELLRVVFVCLYR